VAVAILCIAIKAAKTNMVPDLKGTFYMFITDKSNKHHKPDTINKLRLAYRTIVRFVTGHVYSLTDPVYVEQISTLSSNST